MMMMMIIAGFETEGFGFTCKLQEMKAHYLFPRCKSFAASEWTTYIC
jgi:hypothetical protein